MLKKAGPLFIVALLALTPILMAGAFLTRRADTDILANSADVGNTRASTLLHRGCASDGCAATTPPEPDGTTESPGGTTQSPGGTTQSEETGVVDLFGNEVNTAVAKYKFDTAGSLYEVHSPRTELPRLAPPKS